MQNGLSSKHIFVYIFLLVFVITGFLVGYYLIKGGKIEGFFQEKSQGKKMVYELLVNVNTYKTTRDIEPMGTLIKGRQFFIILDQDSWVKIQPFSFDNNAKVSSYWIKKTDLKYKEVELKYE